MLEAVARLEEQAREFQPLLQELLDHFGVSMVVERAVLPF
jgi:hypothetical protein